MKLKEYGGAVITLAVGPTAKGYLGQVGAVLIERRKFHITFGLNRLLFLTKKMYGILFQLSSGLNCTFVSNDYAVSAALASQISSKICGPEPLFTTTEYPSSSTNLPTTTITAAPPPFDCNPDVAFLFDSSSFNSNDSTIAAVVNYVADSVVKNWAVNMQATEAAITYATTGHTLYGYNYWEYGSRTELQTEMHRVAAFGVFQGDPSVKA